MHIFNKLQPVKDFAANIIQCLRECFANSIFCGNLQRLEEPLPSHPGSDENVKLYSDVAGICVEYQSCRLAALLYTQLFRQGDRWCVLPEDFAPSEIDPDISRKYVNMPAFAQGVWKYLLLDIAQCNYILWEADGKDASMLRLDDKSKRFFIAITHACGVDHSWIRYVYNKEFSNIRKYRKKKVAMITATKKN